MIAETSLCSIVLQLTDQLVAQLQPVTAGLEIAACTASPGTQRLSMRAEIYAALLERVGSALDEEVRWRPNEYEGDGFVERVRPLEPIRTGL